MKTFVGSCVCILSSLTVVNADCGQPQTGGGDVLEQQKCAAVGADRAGPGWAAGLQGGGRWALCTLGARILLQLLDAQYEPRSKNMRLARFAILNLRTHAGHPDVDAGRTRDVDALD